VAQLINFTLLLVVFSLLLYKPLLKVLDERKKRIQEGLEASDEAKLRLAQTEQEVAKELDKARQEGQGLITQAQQISARIQDRAGPDRGICRDMNGVLGDAGAISDRLDEIRLRDGLGHEGTSNSVW